MKSTKRGRPSRKSCSKRKKNTKPRSWEEYCDLQITNDNKGYCINGLTSEIVEVHWDQCATTDLWRNVLPSRELAEASRAMMQLMSIRQEWIGDWRPVWNGGGVYKHCIVIFDDKLDVGEYTLCQHPLSFPTMEMAKEFLVRFKGLLEIAEPLI